MQGVDSLEKTLMLGGSGGREEKGTTEDEMAGWHHQLDGHKFEWTPGVGDGQGGLVCCDSWGHKESDKTECLDWTELKTLQKGDYKDSFQVHIFKWFLFDSTGPKILIYRELKTICCGKKVTLWFLYDSVSNFDSTPDCILMECKF